MALAGKTRIKIVPHFMRLHEWVARIRMTQMETHSGPLPAGTQAAGRARRAR